MMRREEENLGKLVKLLYSGDGSITDEESMNGNQNFIEKVSILGSGMDQKDDFKAERKI